MSEKIYTLFGLSRQGYVITSRRSLALMAPSKNSLIVTFYMCQMILKEQKFYLQMQTTMDKFMVTLISNRWDDILFTVCNNLILIISGWESVYLC